MSRSIPDNQTVADIWAAVKNRSIPTKSLTKAEYDILDETQKNADILYVVQALTTEPSQPSHPSISDGISREEVEEIVQEKISAAVSEVKTTPITKERLDDILGSNLLIKKG